MKQPNPLPTISSLDEVKASGVYRFEAQGDNLTLVELVAVTLHLDGRCDFSIGGRTYTRRRPGDEWIEVTRLEDPTLPD